MVQRRQIMMNVRLMVSALGVFISALNCNASVIDFRDLGGPISVTIDGNPISNGGRVSNLQVNTESVSFDLLLNPSQSFSTVVGFTRLLDPGNTVSDVLEYSIVLGAPTYHVQIGSDPQLPVIPEGATDLTTIPQQGLPADPFYENGALQLVGTAFTAAPGFGNDTFYIQSAVAAPEPASVGLLGAGLVLCALVRRRMRSV
jgi:hypothetical protein